MRRHYGLFTSLLAGAALSFMPQAIAVTVDINIVSDGEPVPTATVTFETESGEAVAITALELDPQDPLLVEEEIIAQPDPEETPVSPETPSSSSAALDEPKGNDGTSSGVDGQVEEEANAQEAARLRVEVPDSVVDQPLVMVVREADRVVKREPVRLGPDTSAIAVETYDPADAALSVTFSQPDVCRRGQACRYVVSATNEGAGIYSGPLFLTGPLNGTLGRSALKDSPWWCAPMRGGRQICHADVTLEPGESEDWRLSAHLPERLGGGRSNCLAATVFDEASGTGRVDPLVQAIQVGLARAGVNPGAPDGIHGPRTEAAILDYLRREGQPESTDLVTLFEALYGLPLHRFARLRVIADGVPSCAPLALERPPRQAKPVARTQEHRQPPGPAEPRNIFDNPAVGIGIGIGIGVMTDGFQKGRRHRHRRDRHDRNREERWNGWEDR